MTITAELGGAGQIRDRYEAAFSLPLGMASPLWLAYGAAASVGVTWWWMTRWTRAVNLEAQPIEIPESLAAASVAQPEIVPEPVISTAVSDEPAPAVDVAPVDLAEPDDLTRLVGVGPKIAEALAARGVTRFAQLAAWGAQDLAAFDTEMSLLGRPVRDAWVAQAKRLASDV